MVFIHYIFRFILAQFLASGIDTTTTKASAQGALLYHTSVTGPVPRSSQKWTNTVDTLSHQVSDGVESVGSLVQVPPRSDDCGLWRELFISALIR